MLFSQEFPQIPHLKELYMILDGVQDAIFQRSICTLCLQSTAYLHRSCAKSLAEVDRLNRNITEYLRRRQFHTFKKRTNLFLILILS